MTFDTHRYTLKLPDRLTHGKPLETSVIDAGPQYGRGPRQEQPTMVFLHGFGGRAGYWEHQLEQFQVEYRVIALDLRGHGYTDAPGEADGARYDVPELVDDIIAALALYQQANRFAHGLIRMRVKPGERVMLATDALGELWVRGPQVFDGYDVGNSRDGEHQQRMRELTAERLRGGWLATGDIASIDADGYVSIIDRKENMLVRGGERVFPRQIEDVLFEHPAVAVAQVKWAPDEEGVIHLRAHIMLHHSMHATTEELRKYASKRLQASALPDSIAIE